MTSALRHYIDGTSTITNAPAIHYHTRTDDGFDQVGYEEQADARKDAIKLQHMGHGDALISMCPRSASCPHGTVTEWVQAGGTNLYPDGEAGCPC
jgi:hypothetical protein